MKHLRTFWFIIFYGKDELWDKIVSFLSVRYAPDMPLLQNKLDKFNTSS